MPPARFERTAQGLGKVCGGFCSALLDATRANFHGGDHRRVLLGDARFCPSGSNLSELTKNEEVVVSVLLHHLYIAFDPAMCPHAGPQMLN